MSIVDRRSKLPGGPAMTSRDHAGDVVEVRAGRASSLELLDLLDGRLVLELSRRAFVELVTQPRVLVLQLAVVDDAVEPVADRVG